MKNLLVAIISSCGIAVLGGACVSNDACPNDPAKVDAGACGCGVADIDADGNGVFDCQDVDGTLTANWVLVQGDNNSVTGCPAGATTVALIAQDPAGGQTTDVFSCAAGSGMSARLLADTYLVWLQVTDDSGETLYAQSLSTDAVVVAGRNASVSFEVSLDRGAFYFAWDIEEGGAPSDCDTVGGAEVSLVSTDANGDFWDDGFPCLDGGGTSKGLALGSYSESVSLLDDAGLAIVVADVVEGALEYGNHFFDLGLFILDPAGP